MKFLIFDAPVPGTIDAYIREMQSMGTTDVVRVCEPTYDKTKLEEKGIRVHDWAFSDGDSPPVPIVTQWLDLIKERQCITMDP